MISAIILAGGKGTRMGTNIPKQFLRLREKMVLSYCLELFLSIPEISEVIVVCDPMYRKELGSLPIKFADPGARRQDSLENGLKVASENSKWVMIHDGARPCIEKKHVLELINEGKITKAATLGVPLRYTVKEVDHLRHVKQTLDREQIFEIQTPQFLERDLLERGMHVAKTHQLTVTDDVAFAELLGHPVKIVLGSPRNLKITVPEDLKIAEFYTHET